MANNDDNNGNNRGSNPDVEETLLDRLEDVEPAPLSGVRNLTDEAFELKPLDALYTQLLSDAEQINNEELTIATGEFVDECRSVLTPDFVRSLDDLENDLCQLLFDIYQEWVVKLTSLESFHDEAAVRNMYHTVREAFTRVAADFGIRKKFINELESHAMASRAPSQPGSQQPYMPTIPPQSKAPGQGKMEPTNAQLDGELVRATVAPKADDMASSSDEPEYVADLEVPRVPTPPAPKPVSPDDLAAEAVKGLALDSDPEDEFDLEVPRAPEPRAERERRDTLSPDIEVDGGLRPSRHPKPTSSRPPMQSLKPVVSKKPRAITLQGLDPIAALQEEMPTLRHELIQYFAGIYHLDRLKGAADRSSDIEEIDLLGGEEVVNDFEIALKNTWDKQALALWEQHGFYDGGVTTELQESIIQSVFDEVNIHMARTNVIYGEFTLTNNQGLNKLNLYAVAYCQREFIGIKKSDVPPVPEQVLRQPEIPAAAAAPDIDFTSSPEEAMSVDAEESEIDNMLDASLGLGNKGDELMDADDDEEDRETAIHEPAAELMDAADDEEERPTSIFPPTDDLIAQSQRPEQIAAKTGDTLPSMKAVKEEAPTEQPSTSSDDLASALRQAAEEHDLPVDEQGEVLIPGDDSPAVFENPSEEILHSRESLEIMDREAQALTGQGPLQETAVTPVEQTFTEPHSDAGINQPASRIGGPSPVIVSTQSRAGRPRRNTLKNATGAPPQGDGGTAPEPQKPELPPLPADVQSQVPATSAPESPKRHPSKPITPDKPLYIDEHPELVAAREEFSRQSADKAKGQTLVMEAPEAAPSRKTETVISTPVPPQPYRHPLESVSIADDRGSVPSLDEVMADSMRGAQMPSTSEKPEDRSIYDDAEQIMKEHREHESDRPEIPVHKPENVSRSTRNAILGVMAILGVTLGGAALISQFEKTPGQQDKISEVDPHKSVDTSPKENQPEVTPDKTPEEEAPKVIERSVDKKKLESIKENHPEFYALMTSPFPSHQQFGKTLWNAAAKNATQAQRAEMRKVMMKLDKGSAWHVNKSIGEGSPSDKIAELYPEGSYEYHLIKLHPEVAKRQISWDKFAERMTAQDKEALAYWEKLMDEMKAQGHENPHYLQAGLDISKLTVVLDLLEILEPEAVEETDNSVDQTDTDTDSDTGLQEAPIITPDPAARPSTPRSEYANNTERNDETDGDLKDMQEIPVLTFLTDGKLLIPTTETGELSISPKTRMLELLSKAYSYNEAQKAELKKSIDQLRMTDYEQYDALENGGLVVKVSAEKLAELKSKPQIASSTPDTSDLDAGWDTPEADIDEIDAEWGRIHAQTTAKINLREAQVKRMAA